MIKRDFAKSCTETNFGCIFNSAQLLSNCLRLAWLYTIRKGFIEKNIGRHTADTIVPWPNPKQCVIDHASDLMMTIRQSMYILSTITREMGTLNMIVIAQQNSSVHRCMVAITTAFVWFINRCVFHDSHWVSRRTNLHAQSWNISSICKIAQIVILCRVSWYNYTLVGNKLRKP